MYMLHIWMMKGHDYLVSCSKKAYPITSQTCHCSWEESTENISENTKQQAYKLIQAKTVRHVAGALCKENQEEGPQQDYTARG